MTRASSATGPELGSEDVNLESGLVRAPDSPTRAKVFVSVDGPRVKMVLEFGFGSADITVRCGERALAVMDRRDFVAWLWRGGELVAGDLTWSVEGESTSLSIAGGHRFRVDGRTIVNLARIV